MRLTEARTFSVIWRSSHDPARIVCSILQEPAKYLDQVNAGPLHIERDAGSVIMISEDEFEGWKETIYLLQTTANAEDLLQAIKAADAGKLVEHEPAGKQ